MMEWIRKVSCFSGPMVVDLAPGAIGRHADSTKIPFDYYETHENPSFPSVERLYEAFLWHRPQFPRMIRKTLEDSGTALIMIPLALDEGVALR